MKKLVLFAAVALSMSVFSCGNGEKGACCDSDSCAQDTTPAQVDTTAQVDTAAVDTTVKA